jgi:hypothetical protein
MLATTGLNHGIFEVLQGNTPTGGLVIPAIGEAQRMWVQGGEEAFTIIPNVLATGILAIAVSLAVAVWSVGFVHNKHGPPVLLLLCALLFLFGGGIAAPVVLAPPIWGAAARVNKPLAWWRRVLPEGVRRVLGPVWP